MANNTDFNLPYTALYDQLTEVFKSDVNRSLFSTIIDRYVSRNEAVHVMGVVGKPTSADQLRAQLTETTASAQANQLQPMMFATRGNVTHATSFEDVINKLGNQGVDLNSLQEWGQTEQYQFWPHIDPDKFANYTNYFWAPPTDRAGIVPQYACIENRCRKTQAELARRQQLVNRLGALHAIVDCKIADRTFCVSGDKTEMYIPQFSFELVSSHPDVNATQWTCEESTYNVALNQTYIRVREQILTYAAASIVTNAGVAAAHDAVISMCGIGEWDDALLDDNASVLADIPRTQNPNPMLGDLWFDTSADELFQYDGSAWKIIYEKFSKVIGRSTGKVVWDAVLASYTPNSPWAEHNYWIHKDLLDESNVETVVRAQYPIIEYDSRLVVAEWGVRSHTWKYRAGRYEPFIECTFEPRKLELIQPVSSASAGSVGTFSIDVEVLFEVGDVVHLTSTTRSTHATIQSVTSGGSDVHVTFNVDISDAQHWMVSPVATSQGHTWQGANVHWMYVGSTDYAPCNAPEVVPDSPLTSSSEYTISGYSVAVHSNNRMASYDVNLSTLSADQLDLVYADGVELRLPFSIAHTQGLQIEINGKWYYGRRSVVDGNKLMLPYDARTDAALVTIVVRAASAARADYGLDMVPVRVNEADPVAVEVVTLTKYTRMPQIFNPGQKLQHPQFEARSIAGQQYRSSILRYGVDHTEMLPPAISTIEFVLDIVPSELSLFTYENAEFWDDGVEVKVWNGNAWVRSWNGKLVALAESYAEDGQAFNDGMGNVRVKTPDGGVWLGKLTVSALDPNVAAVWSNQNGVNATIRTVDRTGTIADFGSNSGYVVYRGAQSTRTYLTGVDADNNAVWSAIAADAYTFQTPEHAKSVVSAYEVSTGRSDAFVGDTTLTYSIPNQFTHNPLRETVGRFLYPDLYSHFSSIVNAQPRQVGLPYGNNVHTCPIGALQKQLGGHIKNHSDGWDVAIGMSLYDSHNIKDVLRYVPRHHEQLLVGVDGVFFDALVPFLKSKKRSVVDDPAGMIVAGTMYVFNGSQRIAEILDDGTATKLLSESNSLLQYWVTTPQVMGIVPAQKPALVRDWEGVAVRGHDGAIRRVADVRAHVRKLMYALQRDASPSDPIISIQDTAPPNTMGLVIRKMLADDVMRGLEQTSASRVELVSAIASKLLGAVWFNRASSMVHKLACNYIQLEEPKTTVHGSTWLELPSTLYTINVSSLVDEMVNNCRMYTFDDSTNTWKESQLAFEWVLLDIQALRAEVLHYVEQQLYAIAVGGDRLTSVLNAAAVDTAGTTMKLEFLSYCKERDVDPYDMKYDVANPWTWNCSIIAPGKACWQAAYEHLYGTAYLCDEPWKVQGYANRPNWWGSAFTSPGDMWAAIVAGVNPSGDGVVWKYYDSLPVDPTLNVVLPPYAAGYHQSQKFRPCVTNLNDFVGAAVRPSWGEGGLMEWNWANSLAWVQAAVVACYVNSPILTLGRLYGNPQAVVAGIKIDVNTRQIPSVKRTGIHARWNEIRGLAQWVVHYDRYVGVDDVTDMAARLANWQPKLSYQFHGMVDGDTVDISTQIQPLVGGTDYNIRLVKSTAVDHLLYHGLSIRAVSVPYSTSPREQADRWVFELDTAVVSNPSLTHYLPADCGVTIEPSTGIFTASRDIVWNTGDAVWFESVGTLPILIDSYDGEMARLYMDTTVPYYVVSIVNADGSVDPRRFRIAQTYNEALEYRWIGVEHAGSAGLRAFQQRASFNVNNSYDVWAHKQLTTSTGELQLPARLTGVQQVLDVIDGYAAHLTDLGFVFDDQVGVRINNWQLAAEQFVEWTYNLQLSAVSTQHSRLVYTVGSDVMENAGNPVATGDAVVLQCTGTMPEPFIAGLPYYARVGTVAGTVQLCLSKADAILGNAVSVERAGTGVMTMAPFKVATATTPTIFLNPGQNRLVVRNYRGVVADVSATDGISARVVDWAGNRITPTSIGVYREDRETVIESVDVMASVSLVTDTYRHVCIFEDKCVDGQVIYDPFHGKNVPYIQVAYSGSAIDTGRPVLGGYVVAGHQLIPNFETTLERTRLAYEVNSGNQIGAENQRARHTLGFTRQSWMDHLELTNDSAYGLWRGATKHKGAAETVSALANATWFEDVYVDEFWAVKIAEFGSVGGRDVREYSPTYTDGRPWSIPLAPIMAVGSFITIYFSDVAPVDTFLQAEFWFNTSTGVTYEWANNKWAASQRMSITPVRSGDRFVYVGKWMYENQTFNISRTYGTSAQSSSINWSYVHSPLRDRYVPVEAPAIRSVVGGVFKAVKYEDLNDLPVSGSLFFTEVD